MTTNEGTWGNRALQTLLGSRARASTLTWLVLHPDEAVLLRDLARALRAGPNRQDLRLSPWQLPIAKVFIAHGVPPIAGAGRIPARPSLTASFARGILPSAGPQRREIEAQAWQ